jgi:hypothetical protein
MRSVEDYEVGRDRDRVRQTVADRRGVLDVLAELLELFLACVRALHPARGPNGGEPGARAFQSQEAVEIKVALDLVAQLADLDASSGGVVDIADRVAEAERLEQELDRVGALVRAEEHRRFVPGQAERLGPHRRLAGMDEVLDLALVASAGAPRADALNVKAATFGSCWTAPIVAMSCSTLTPFRAVMVAIGLSPVVGFIRSPQGGRPLRG